MSGKIKRTPTKQRTPIRPPKQPTRPKRDEKGFGTNSAGSGKQVHVDPDKMMPGELPWLENLDQTMYA